MKCIVCGGFTWEYLYPVKDRMFGVPGKFSEYHCERCGLVRLDPKPANIKKYYPSGRYYSYQTVRPSFFGKLRAFLIAHELFFLVPAMPRLRERGKILDVGCGSGDTLAQLKSLGWDVYGLDIDATAIQAARRRELTNVSVGTYKDVAKYPDNFFDTIRLYHVIEHLEEPEDCLRIAYKKLKPGGEMIIGTPNAESLIAKLARKYWLHLDAPRHLFLFTPRNLGTLLVRSGFGHLRVSFCSAGGWVGSLQYVLEETFARRIDLINQPWLVILWYPFEWLLDRFGWGDVFVIHARKTE